MPPCQMYNYFEIVLWTTIGVVVAIKCSKTSRQVKKLGLAAACAFFVFAVSDYIEIHTGAWWDPWWLLAMKASCVGVFGLTYCLYISAKRREDGGKY